MARALAFVAYAWALVRDDQDSGLVGAPHTRRINVIAAERVYRMNVDKEP